MAKVTLRNVNPVGFVDLPLIGRVGPAVDADGTPTAAGSGCLVPGEEFEVDAELAGRAPSVTTKDGVEVHDPGEGLLAQVGNYELVTPKKKG